MKKDAAARAAILTALERQLKKGDKSLVGNTGYRRFLATPGDDHRPRQGGRGRKIRRDLRFADQRRSHAARMLCYKRLWMVERAFRTSKSLFATRPIFHKLDETIRRHVSCSFLALVLKKELEDRIANMGKPAAASDNAENGSWPDVLADLDSLRPRSSKTANAFSCARRRAPRRASPYAPPASLCPRQCVNSPTPDPALPAINGNVVPRRFSSADLTVLPMRYKF